MAFDTTHTRIKSFGVTGDHAGARAFGRHAYITRQNLRDDAGHLFRHRDRGKSPCEFYANAGFLGLEPATFWARLERQGYKKDGTIRFNGKDADGKPKAPTVAKEIEFSLPRDLDVDTLKALAGAICAAFHARTGLPCEAALHLNDDAGEPNPHVHLLFSDYRLAAGPDGPAFERAKATKPGGKAALFDAPRKGENEALRAFRKDITERFNGAMAATLPAVEEQIAAAKAGGDADRLQALCEKAARLRQGWDDRSYEERGIDKAPGQHVGHGGGAQQRAAANAKAAEIEAMKAEVRDLERQAHRLEQRERAQDRRPAIRPPEPTHADAFKHRALAADGRPDHSASWKRRILSEVYGAQPPADLVDAAARIWTSRRPDGALNLLLSDDRGRLVDRGDGITFAPGAGGRSDDPDAIRAMVAMAQQHGWPSVVISGGTPEFREAATRAALAAGLEVERSPENTPWIDQARQEMQAAAAEQRRRTLTVDDVVAAAGAYWQAAPKNRAALLLRFGERAAGADNAQAVIEALRQAGPQGAQGAAYVSAAVLAHHYARATRPNVTGADVQHHRNQAIAFIRTVPTAERQRVVGFLDHLHPPAAEAVRGMAQHVPPPDAQPQRPVPKASQAPPQQAPEPVSAPARPAAPAGHPTMPKPQPAAARAAQDFVARLQQGADLSRHLVRLTGPEIDAVGAILKERASPAVMARWEDLARIRNLAVDAFKANAGAQAARELGALSRRVDAATAARVVAFLEAKGEVMQDPRFGRAADHLAEIDRRARATPAPTRPAADPIPLRPPAPRQSEAPVSAKPAAPDLATLARQVAVARSMTDIPEHALERLEDRLRRAAGEVGDVALDRLARDLRSRDAGDAGAVLQAILDRRREATAATDSLIRHGLGGPEQPLPVGVVSLDAWRARRDVRPEDDQPATPKLGA